MGSARTRTRTSSLGGVPTTLAEATVVEPRQLALGTGAGHAGRAGSRRGAARRRPPADWLPLERSARWSPSSAEWALPPAGLRHPRVPAGHLMTVQSVCLGWHWQPYAYSRTADDTDGAPVKPLPPTSCELARAAVADTFGDEQARGTRRTPRSSTSTRRGPGWACIRTARSRRTLRSSRSASATHACSAWPASTAARRRSPSRAALRRPARVRRAEPPHLPRRAQGAPGTGPASAPPGRLSITVRETGFSRVDELTRDGQATAPARLHGGGPASSRRGS